ncbi:MAG: type II secretion system F family protein, partial [Bacteriovoracaceae bacterium]|nr:type II secretion system F family protein [Bacteriovoracaceae bacterium]
PVYQYKGLNKLGKEVSATIHSDSMPLAKQKVRALGIMILEIAEMSTDKKSSSKLFRSGIKIQDLALMTRQFSTLIRAKIQLVEALNALSEQVDHPELRMVLGEIKTKVNEGSALSKAFADYPKIFDNIYVSMVEAGEASGTLEIVLLRLADFTESQNRLKTKLKSALTYPIIMMLTSFLMIGIIFVKVIPQIASLLSGMDKELPLQTKICIAISNFLVDYWYIVIIGFVVFFFMAKKYIKTESGKSRFDAWQLKLPVFGNIIKMANINLFCSTLATLLNAGVPILSSMNIVKNLISNVHMKDAIEKAKINVSEGKTLTTPLAQSGHFPPMVTHMIRLGEQSGELEPMLEIVSRNYGDQVEAQLSGLTSLLEPIMLLFMGGIVGFVVFSVIVPLMELNNVR